MSTARHLHYTYADYLRVEAESPIKHEFSEGEIYAMAGGTPEHAALAMRVGAILTRVLSNCTVFSSDMRLRIGASDLTTYPDVSVVCGKLSRSGDDPLAITNPGVIVEVTSPSTEDYDRGEKLDRYRSVPSLKTVLIVSHRGPRITVWTRNSGGWGATEVGAGQRVVLEAGSFDVDEVFSVLAALT